MNRFAAPRPTSEDMARARAEVEARYRELRSRPSAPSVIPPPAEGMVSVSTLAKRMGLPYMRLSQHRQSGFLRAVKRRSANGKLIWYVSKDEAKRYAELMKNRGDL